MQKKRNILFDLDGTLTDPKEGITKSVCYALERFGIQVENPDSLVPFIGPPLKKSFEEFYGFSSDEADRAISFYREYFAEYGLFENAVYEGIPALLSALKNQGKRIFLATSKPTIYAGQILEHFELSSFFDGVCGSELSGERVEKTEVIAHTLKTFEIAPETAVMIGDRRFDIESGNALGLSTIGVLYGHGSQKEIETAKPDVIAETVKDVEKILGI